MFWQVKPSTIQVNLANCCSVSEELTEFARDHDVQVLTHTDDTGTQKCTYIYIVMTHNTK